MVNFSTCVIYENKLWFITDEGILMNYDLVTESTQIVVPDNVADLHIKYVTDKMLQVNDKIYFILQDGSKLYEYCPLNNHCDIYNMPELEMINWGCFAGIFKEEDSLLFIAKEDGKILQFNCANKKIATLQSGCKQKMDRAVRYGDSVFLASEKEIWKLNIKTLVYEKEYQFQKEAIARLCCSQDYIYVIMESNRIFKYDIAKKNSLEMPIAIHEENPYGQCIDTEGKLFLLPGSGRNMYCIRKTDGMEQQVEQPIDLIYQEKGWAKYYNYCEDSDYFYLANRTSNYFLKIKKKTGEMIWIQMEDLRNTMERYKWLKNDIMDEKMVGLDFFLHFIEKG